MGLGGHGIAIGVCDLARNLSYFLPAFSNSSASFMPLNDQELCHRRAVTLTTQRNPETIRGRLPR